MCDDFIAVTNALMPINLIKNLIDDGDTFKNLILFWADTHTDGLVGNLGCDHSSKEEFTKRKRLYSIILHQLIKANGGQLRKIKVDKICLQIICVPRLSTFIYISTCRYVGKSASIRMSTYIQRAYTDAHI